MPRLTRVPSAAVEVVRALVVVLGAAVGQQIAVRLAPDPDAAQLGSLSAEWIGVIVGAGAGFVVGGILARLVLRALDQGEAALSGLPAEQVVAGGLASLVSGLLAAVVAWPVFVIWPPGISVPVFLLIVVVAVMFGFRVGRRRRDAVLAVAGSRAGLAPRVASASSLPRVLDTSVAIDGRILDVVEAGFLAGRMLVSPGVLTELQNMADSADDLRRVRGRRGLDVLEALRHQRDIDLEVLTDVPRADTVDSALVALCLQRGAALLTLDTNLARVARVSGARVLNLHALALALRPPVAVGDELRLALVRPGREAGQAVGYLDDGTMVVVEAGRDHVGAELLVGVTSVVLTANGRMVFARPAGTPAKAARRHDPVESMRGRGPGT